MNKYTYDDYKYNSNIADYIFKYALKIFEQTEIYDDIYYYKKRVLDSDTIKIFINNVLKDFGFIAKQGLIVSSGEDTADYHFAGNSIIRHNNLFMMDLFAQNDKNGLWFDKTVTYALGNITEKQQQLMDIVLKVKNSCKVLANDGCIASDLHDYAMLEFELNNFASGKGYGFCHSLGHLVDEELHGKNYIGLKSEYVLKSGDIITIEPGLYYKGIGGVRFEDYCFVQ